MSKNALQLLKNRTKGARQLSLYTKKWKYNVFLLPQKLKKNFVNFATSINFLSSKAKKSKKNSTKRNIGRASNYQILSKLFRFFSGALMIAGVFIFLLGALLFGYIRYNNSDSTIIPQVAGVRDGGEYSQNPFDSWMLQKTGAVTVRDEDTDGDGLTNYEEFLLGSDPSSEYSCDNEKKDVELVLEFVNPGTCNPVNLESELELQEFSDIVNVELIQQGFVESLAEVPEVAENSSGAVTVKEVFGATSLEELNGITEETVNTEEEQKRIAQKAEYIELIRKVDAYMLQNRSLEPYDRNYDIPVTGAVYVQVAEQYDMPLKYVMAISQRESRFGTDRYDNNGFLTRPGQYENIVAMGLDDSGNNMSFGSWEGSLEALGKWYRRFDDAGVDDCRKWRIYNPNGDYCERINQVVAEFEYFMANN